MKENNKIIAEFIGYKIENKKFQTLEYHSSNESDWVWNKGEIVTLNDHEVSDFNNEPYFSLEDLPFAESWDWLIPVVNKIQKLCNQENNLGTKLVMLIMKIEKTFMFNVEIEKTFEAVVNFINHYNTTREK